MRRKKESNQVTNKGCGDRWQEDSGSEEGAVSHSGLGRGTTEKVALKFRAEGQARPKISHPPGHLLSKRGTCLHLHG